MKLIIAGSRHIHINNEELLEIINEKLGTGWLNTVDEIVSGCAIGVDRSGEELSKYLNLKLSRFPASWRTCGLGAGPKRNLDMAEYSDLLLLIWDGKSRGSANIKARMLGMNKPVYEVVKR